MNAAPVLTPRTNRALECGAKSVYLCSAQSAPRFVVGQSRAGSDFAVAFACAVAWSLLWILLLSAAFSLPDRVGVDGLAATGYSSAEIDSQGLAWPRGGTASPGSAEAASCGGAMIEIDGSCVLGEDLEVRPPSGWSRR